MQRPCVSAKSFSVFKNEIFCLILTVSLKEKKKENTIKGICMFLHSDSKKLNEEKYVHNAHTQTHNALFKLTKNVHVTPGLLCSVYICVL